MLHEHCDHHVYQNELSREHEGHEIHWRDELQSGVAAVVTSWAIWWALSQGVLVDRGVLGEEQEGRVKLTDRQYGSRGKVDG